LINVVGNIISYESKRKEIVVTALNAWKRKMMDKKLNNSKRNLTFEHRIKI
jgi:hypothetical protein